MNLLQVLCFDLLTYADLLGPMCNAMGRHEVTLPRPACKATSCDPARVVLLGLPWHSGTTQQTVKLLQQHDPETCHSEC